MDEDVFVSLFSVAFSALSLLYCSLLSLLLSPFVIARSLLYCFHLSLLLSSFFIAHSLLYCSLPFLFSPFLLARSLLCLSMSIPLLNSNITVALFFLYVKQALMNTRYLQEAATNTVGHLQFSSTRTAEPFYTSPPCSLLPPVYTASRLSLLFSAISSFLSFPLSLPLNKLSLPGSR